jgi:hypothetical protein
VDDESIASGDAVVTGQWCWHRGASATTVTGLSWYMFDEDDLFATTWSLINQETIDDPMRLEE